MVVNDFNAVDIENDILSVHKFLPSPIVSAAVPSFSKIPQR
jgi:hypothetical protein